MAADGTLAVNDRVWHESQQFVPAGNRRYGSVTMICTRGTEQCAKVRWDGNSTLAITYPVASLTKARTGS